MRGRSSMRGSWLVSCAVVAAAALCFSPRSARAEQSERLVPVLGLSLAPAMSVVFGSDAVTSVYGAVHPAGAFGLTVRLSERFALILDLEMSALGGEYQAPAPPPVGSVARSEPPPVDMRFLSYWVHVRARTLLGRVNIVSFHGDVAVAAMASREDGDRFRSEGGGVSVGAGPVMEVALGRYLSLSLGVLIETGWAWYDVQSEQGRGGEESYVLLWPRAVVSLALSGFFVHRIPRGRAREIVAEEPPPAQAPERAEEPAGESEVAPPWDAGEGEPEAAPAEQPSSQDVTSPW